MFTTFVGPDGPETVAARLGRRRPAVARACADCQRRKVKCDGQLPCRNCRVALVTCQYLERRRRPVDGTRLPVTHHGDADAYVAIFKQLFGPVTVSDVQGCSRDRLLDMLTKAADTERTSPNSRSPTTAGPNPGAMLQTPSASPAVSEAVQRLQTLENGALEGFQWDESNVSLQDAAADDVNALSLSAHSRSSFLGIFSVAAVVRVLVKVLPGSLQQDSETHPIKVPDEGPAESPTFLHQSLDCLPQIPYHEGQRLIDAYFTHVHVFAPMVHEPTFRAQYLARSRRGSPWMALYYMVLALGSIASSTSDSEDDIVYYRAAQAHLGLESFGSGQMETLQALILMGGLYLHYRNRPNTASAIMGAADRIASGLGLHRESPGQRIHEATIETETKRRTWACASVLDSWGSLTLGRPYHAVKFEVKLPRNLVDDQTGEVPANEPTVHSPLIHNIALSTIVGQIQARLQTSPILDWKEIGAYDKMLVDWYQQLPPFMRPPNPCPEPLQVVRAVLAWRYQNIRILLHRAVMLDATIRQVSFASLGQDEQQVVAQCRHLAADAIQTVRSEWRPAKMSGWNGVWFLFQACLIPLMALAIEPPVDPAYAKWREQVQLGIELCERMKSWSRVGKKTKGVLERLLQGTERACDSDIPTNPGATFEQLPGDFNQSYFVDDWSDVMGGLNFDALDQGFFGSAGALPDGEEGMGRWC